MNIQNLIQAHTTEAIEHIAGDREAIELVLDEAQDAQEERDSAARELLQTELVTLKNKLWKDLSWIVKNHQKKVFGYGRYGSYGRSYGSYKRSWNYA